MDKALESNNLMRMQANLTEDIPQREALFAEADRLRDRAEEFQKLQTAGAS